MHDPLHLKYRNKNGHRVEEVEERGESNMVEGVKEIRVNMLSDSNALENGERMNMGNQ
jgi:hypothetical protein